MSLMGGFLGADQDWVDRANGFWSVLLLALCSLGAFFMRYASQPITCFTPAEFPQAATDYTHSTCFTRANYTAVGNAGSVPGEDDDREHIYSYHLWIPLILFFQALCFKVPSIIWTAGKNSLAINVDNTVKTLGTATTTNPETRDSVIKVTARVFSKVMDGNKFVLAVFYLFVKLLYCLNLFGQFLFLTIFFRNTLLVRAGELVNFDIEYYIKPLFYNTVICDFAIIRFGNLRVFSVQCNMIISEMYEKLFVFLWYWVFFLAILTILNLLIWIGFLFLPFLRNKRITNYIQASKSDQDSSAITRFIDNFLGSDGVLVLSMISLNSSEMMSAELSQQLYQVFLEKGDEQPKATGASEPAPSPSTPIIVVEEVPLEDLNDGGCSEKTPLA